MDEQHPDPHDERQADGLADELLLAHEFGAFEDALDDLRERGFVVRAPR